MCIQSKPHLASHPAPHMVMATGTIEFFKHVMPGLSPPPASPESYKTAPSESRQLRLYYAGPPVKKGHKGGELVQRAASLFADEEGFELEITDEVEDWADKMSHAQFCLAPAEDGCVPWRSNLKNET
jgi:hypothetical protein